MYFNIKNGDSEKEKVKKYVLEEKIENLQENKTMLFNWSFDTINAIEFIE